MPSTLPSTIPKTQRQWRQVRRGAPKDCLELCEDAPVPVPQKGEVLVKMAYATLTPSSWKLMKIVPYFLRKHAVPELEGSGRIVDPNGSDFAVGDEVLCVLDEDVEYMRQCRGTLTEYALFKADNVMHVPANYTLESATGLTVGGMTAYKALVEVANLQPGARIFINGGTTASGLVGIQMAKILGASNITVSCSPASFDLVRELGADEAIDYRASPLPAQLSSRFAANPFDVVYDCIGSRPLIAACPKFLKPKGPYVTIALDIPEGAKWTEATSTFFGFAMDMKLSCWLGGIPRKVIMSQTPTSRHRMVDWLKWAGEGKVKHFIDSVHKANREGVLAAYERGMSGRAKGKILVNMEDF